MMARATRHVLYTAAGLALAGATWAAAPVNKAVPDSLALYSHAIPVNFQGHGGLVQLRLPQDAYLQARSPTLADLRLFDGQGRPVPFALTMPSTQRAMRHVSTPARVFALGADAKLDAGAVAIRATADGTVISVDHRAAKPSAADTLGGLLIDLGQAAPGQTMVDALEFTAPPGADNYSARVTLEASDNLQDWASVTEAQLDWLSNSASDTLTNSRIAFAPRAMRYVRLRWREGTPRQFGAVAAARELVEAVPYAPDTRLVPAQAGPFPGDLVYPIGVAVPVTRIGMLLPESGMVVPSEIGYYVELPSVPGAAMRRAGDRWQFTPLLRTTFYRMAQEGIVRTAPDIDTAPLSVDQLVVRPLTPLASQPPLRVGWLPWTMVFAARTAGPYTLAVGRDGARSVRAPLGDVAPGYRATELLNIASAVAGPATHQRALATQPSSAARAGLSATARTALLWLALLLGVGVLALLSWKMVRQLPPAEPNANTHDADPHPGDTRR